MAVVEREEVATGFVAGTRQPVDAAVVEEALAGVAGAAEEVRALSSNDRAKILQGVADRLARDAAEIAVDLTRESGFLAHRDMVLEVQRSVEVFTHAAAVARIGLTETLNADAVERARHAIGLIRHEPIGPILGITAFNGPMLIPAHKLAPAIVAGAPMVLKPAPRASVAAATLAQYVVEAGWPAAAVAVLPVDNDTTMALVRDPRLPVVSFTGGAVGWDIKDAVPRKHVHLELGGVGAVIVAADADLDDAAAQCTLAGFVRAGQACIAVQRVYVERGAYEEFAAKLAKRVSPLVTEAAAVKVEALIEDARGQGARVLCGGTRRGAIVEPTVVADLTPAMRLARTEAFGPIVAVAPVASLADAVDEANAVGGAIHVGVFTRDVDVALTIADRVRSGGVIVNGPTGWRVDHMPYGGTGTSGFGREGIRAAVAEYTETKVVVIRHRPADLG